MQPGLRRAVQVGLRQVARCGEGRQHTANLRVAFSMDGSKAKQRGRRKAPAEDEGVEAQPKIRRRKTVHVQYEKEGDATGMATATDTPSEVGPAQWQRDLEAIRAMRKDRTAPVDELGCEVLGRLGGEGKGFRFHVLVALMLSSQTKDEVTAAAVKRLSSQGCTPEQLVAMDKDQLAALLKPVGFYNHKATYLQKASQIIINEHGGDIPDTLEGLMALPGVGPKMAHIAMNVAWGRPMGIGVDVHVQRICNRLGWVRTAKPEHTRKALERWLPPSYWGEVNLLLVGLGQQTCTPVRPHCATCLLRTTCPASTVK
eukprot:comp23414_c0_seq1/m.38918 comp23414_c0_seq1/g.38918  ORF comp23414_c0_seq1/g.38918 comp23414_c0_seq1/m.38918 type:complete len:314 (-) comp23414_c0_seq1:65-1006(-)